MPNTDREHLIEVARAAEVFVTSCIDVMTRDEWEDVNDDHSELDSKISAAKYHIASTPDTGGVEGPYRYVEDCIVGPTIGGMHPGMWSMEAIAQQLNAAHKAGASESGEAAKSLAITDRETVWLMNFISAHYDISEPTPAECRAIFHKLCKRVEVESSDGTIEAEGVTPTDSFATQNPASGSDGLRARVEKVLECVEDYGRKLDKGGGEHRMYLRQFIQKELPHKLAAALSDGGMGDE